MSVRVLSRRGACHVRVPEKSAACHQKSTTVQPTERVKYAVRNCVTLIGAGAIGLLFCWHETAATQTLTDGRLQPDRPGRSASATLPAATLIHPADGAVAIDQNALLAWTKVDGADAYYLYVGSTPGAKDLLDSGETRSTTFSVLSSSLPLPHGRTLYATLWTRFGDTWRGQASTFSASPLAPVFVYPVDGATGIDPDLAFRWTAPAKTRTNVLHVGTTPGGSDVFKGETSNGSPSVALSGLPRRGPLYARAFAQVGEIWRYTDIAFTLDASPAPSRIIAPADGQQTFDTARPFEWSSVALARGYRLTIGTSPGAVDLHDSGVIQMTRRFVPDLPIGLSYGRVYTKIDGRWYGNDFTFAVAGNTESAAIQIENALWATHLVRGMAGADNHPFSWTELATRRFFVYCADYAESLIQVWKDMNGRLPARRLDVSLNPNTHDTHTLVELFDADAGRWILLDPTFDLSVKRSDDGAWATAKELSAATRAGRWSDMSYVFLGSGSAFVRNYAIDYPLLYLNVHADDASVPVDGASVLPYMRERPLPAAGAREWYSVRCGDDGPASLRIDGVDQRIRCDGVDNFSPVFEAATITATGETLPSVRLYQPRRYVF